MKTSFLKYKMYLLFIAIVIAFALTLNGCSSQKNSTVTKKENVSTNDTSSVTGPPPPPPHIKKNGLK